MSEITRFEGHVVPGWFGPRPGGGVTGARPDLDQIVVMAAETLAAITDRPVEIRFNSDRLSGGGYLKNEAATLGIGADLVPPEAERAAIRELPFEAHRRAWEEACCARGTIALDVVASASWLADMSTADRGTFGDEYRVVAVDSIAAAVAWIKANCREEKAIRVPRVTLQRWEKRTLWGECDGERRSSRFLDYVRDVGNHAMYAAENEGGAWDKAAIIAHVQARNKLTDKDARDVARAVFRIRPWGFQPHPPQQRLGGDAETVDGRTVVRTSAGPIEDAADEMRRTWGRGVCLLCCRGVEHTRSEHDAEVRANAAEESE